MCRPRVDHIIQRSEFLTSYTPYQPEIAQGTLQVLFEFQTQVAALTGMEVANASLYDGSTATAEAVMMATRVTRRNKAVLSGGVHPHYVEHGRDPGPRGRRRHRAPGRRHRRRGRGDRRHRRRHRLRGRPDPQRVRHGHRRDQDRRRRPGRRRPADRGHHRGVSLTAC
jgi:hypothetical protein